MRARAFDARQLSHAQEKGAKRGKGVDLNGERRLEQGAERNGSALHNGGANAICRRCAALPRRRQLRTGSRRRSACRSWPCRRRRPARASALPLLGAPIVAWSSSCMPGAGTSPARAASSMVSVLLKPCSTTSVE